MELRPKFKGTKHKIIRPSGAHRPPNPIRVGGGEGGAGLMTMCARKLVQNGVKSQVFVHWQKVILEVMEPFVVYPFVDSGFGGRGTSS